MAIVHSIYSVHLNNFFDLAEARNIYPISVGQLEAVEMENRKRKWLNLEIREH